MTVHYLHPGGHEEVFPGLESWMDFSRVFFSPAETNPRLRWSDEVGAFVYLRSNADNVANDEEVIM